MRINNRHLSALFNACDFPIRYMYCRLGPVSRLLNRLAFWKLYSSGDPADLDTKFEKMRSLFSSQQISFEGKIVLELGPGNSLINTYNILKLGAKKIYLVDKYPRYINTEEQRTYRQKELEVLITKYGRAALTFLDEQDQIRPGLVTMIEKDLTEISDLKVDLIFSHGVLEHVKKIDENIQKMAALLNPGGTMYHYINMLDHYNFNAPHLFLKYSTPTWQHFLTKEGVSYTNRWRYRDYHDSFRRAGLRLIFESIQRFPVTQKKLDRQFQNEPDLDIGMIDIILQK